ncbi:hypothetical protein C0Q70_16868 [Pomacea canaliculata]|uniref:Uncharacterized protein n=1 Tax=Pomacea canaliculata TaxID=400727 RepID=A0A2T7NR11_POMCA|nr:hypothetical protein C0Q70_16868 [Pomacea canaliculata]
MAVDLENGASSYWNKKVNGVYQALVTDAFTMYMHHEYQLQQLQHIDPDLDDGTGCPACHVVKEDIEVNAKDPATDGSQLVLSENILKMEQAFTGKRK